VSVKDQVLEAFNGIRDALRAGDTDTLTQLIAEDYRGFDLRGNPEDRKIILEVYRPGGAKLTTYGCVRQAGIDLAPHRLAEYGAFHDVADNSGRVVVVELQKLDGGAVLHDESDAHAG
jgi:hypothetical protein